MSAATASQDRLIRWTATFAVVAVAVIAAYVSYRHAYELAITRGESRSTAAAWPLTVDGLIAAASMVLLQVARRGLRARSAWLAYLMLAAGIAATLGANVMHGLDHGWVGAAVAAWPALALVGSYELLMWLVRTGQHPAGPATSDQVEESGEPVRLTAEEAVAWILDHGVSQRQLAEATGASRDKIRAIVRQSRPPADQVAQIAAVAEGAGA